MKKEYFAYLSLITAISSGIIYVLSHKTLLSMSYLWPFHLLAMIAFGSMIIYKLKSDKSVEVSDSNTWKKSLFILKEKPFLLLMNIISGILLLVLFQYVGNNFMVGVEDDGDIANPINQFSGHWLMFSSIPTVYYFLFEKLQNEFRSC